MSLRILIDANILIAAESDEQPLHINADRASGLLRLSNQSGHRICLGHSVTADIASITAPIKKAARTQQLKKYVVLQPIPFPPDFLAEAGYGIDPSSNDLADAALILAISQGAADWLVTEDRRLRAHADAAGIGEQTFSLADAVDTLSAGLAQPVEHPALQLTEPYQILLNQPFFQGFDDEYDFSTWWKSKVVPENRECLTLGSLDNLQGLAVLNHETGGTWNLPGRVLKICTFKIATEATGVKRGELLLWEICDRARAHSYDSVFVEVHTWHTDVQALFESFGFAEIGTKSHGEPLTTERVLGKTLTPSLAAEIPSDPLRFHERFGPGAISLDRAFVVPITPRWHDMLFPPRTNAPTAQLQFDLGVPANDAAATPFGNAFRKAYVCRSPIKALQRGDVLLFERTRTNQAVTAVGVVEATLRSADPVEIVKFVGRRTVYETHEIGEMCGRGEVLAVRFRLDRVLEPIWSVGELKTARVFPRSPQSVAQVIDAGGLAWIRARLAE